MPIYDKKIVDTHEQLYRLSCIPSCVEIILKLSNLVPVSYYDQQHLWKNKRDGSFSDYDNKEIEGLLFSRQFAHARGNEFPLQELFQTVEAELKENRYVAVSIANASGWHMYIIYDIDTTGNFLSVSKNHKDTIYQDSMLTGSVKGAVSAMRGTDILTYTTKNP